MVMPVTFPGFTLTVAVPLIPFALAVTVTGVEVIAMPITTPVLLLMGAVVLSELDQNTPLVKARWLPSSKVPLAVMVRLVPSWI
jgi:hypothetical protein